MTAYAQFQYADTVFPIPAQAAGKPLLSACDPTIDKLTQFLASVLTTYLGPALLGAASGMSLVDAVVGSIVPIDPQTIAKTDQIKFPLLAMWRDSSEMNDRTTNWRRDITKIRVSYVFPPMSAAQAIRLYPALTAVGQIVNHCLHQGFDPAFNAGERIVSDNHITKVTLNRAEFKRWEAGDTMDFHEWHGELEVIEQEQPYTVGLSKLTHIGTSVTDESVQPGNPIEVTSIYTDPPLL